MDDSKRILALITKLQKIKTSNTINKKALEDKIRKLKNKLSKNQ